MFAMLFQVAIDVFDHHHRRIDHHANADRQTAQRHKVRRQSCVPHQDERYQHAEGNCRRGDERAAKIAEQQHQDNQHQGSAFDERLNHSVHAVIDQLGLIIKINHGHTRRQRLVDLDDLFLDALDYLFGVFVDSLEDNPGDDFTLTVFGDRALTNLVADFDRADVADANWRSAAGIEDDVLNVFYVFD